MLQHLYIKTTKY